MDERNASSCLSKCDPGYETNHRGISTFIFYACIRSGRASVHAAARDTRRARARACVHAWQIHNNDC